jgi:hypothetical protein
LIAGLVRLLAIYRRLLSDVGDLPRSIEGNVSGEGASGRLIWVGLFRDESDEPPCHTIHTNDSERSLHFHRADAKPAEVEQDSHTHNLSRGGSL